MSGLDNTRDSDPDYWMFRSRCNNCSKSYTHQTLINIGWECPNCGAIDWEEL